MSALLNNAVSCFDGLFVTIAGNANGNNDNSNYMMVDYSLSNVISVGSIDSNGERSELIDLLLITLICNIHGSVSKFHISELFLCAN